MLNITTKPAAELAPGDRYVLSEVDPHRGTEARTVARVELSPNKARVYVEHDNDDIEGNHYGRTLDAGRLVAIVAAPRPASAHTAIEATAFPGGIVAVRRSIFGRAR